MIQNDEQLKVTQERVAYFQRLLSQLRVSAKSYEFTSVASSYRAEIEQMQKEVLDYLTRHVTEPMATA